MISLTEVGQLHPSALAVCETFVLPLAQAEPHLRVHLGCRWSQRWACCSAPHWLSPGCSQVQACPCPVSTTRSHSIPKEYEHNFNSLTKINLRFSHQVYLAGLLPAWLVFEKGGRDIVGHLTPGQELGRIVYEAGLGVEEKLRCWPLLLSWICCETESTRHTDGCLLILS